MNHTINQVSKDRKAYKILVPYFLAGSGHLVSGNAIASYLAEKRPNWEVRLYEPADELKSGALDSFFRKSWHFTLSRPFLSKITFVLGGKLFWFIPLQLNFRAVRKAAPAMADFLASYRPDLIMTTHWGCAHLVLEATKGKEEKVPLFLVRNDLGGAYRIQKSNCDLLFLMAEEAVEAFIRLGIPPEKIELVNPLVRREFLTEESAVDYHGTVTPGLLRILLSSGGEGLGDVQKTASIILDIADKEKVDIAIDILSGRNEKLKSHLDRTIKDGRVTIYGYRNDLVRLMKKADLVVGKCGANYSMETIMLRKPFLITQVGAPSEMFNMAFVVKRGCGWYVPTRRKLKKTLSDLFSNPSEILKVKRNLSKFPSKSGAEQIADRIIGELAATDR